MVIFFAAYQLLTTKALPGMAGLFVTDIFLTSLSNLSHDEGCKLHTLLHDKIKNSVTTAC